YPWKDVPGAEEWCNCRGAATAFQKRAVDTMVTKRGKIPHRAVPVDFDPFNTADPKTLADLHYSGKVLHLIGNVGELVRMRPGGGYEDFEFGVAGGDFQSIYQDTQLLRPPLRYNGPDSSTGFRVVIPLPLDRGNADFKAELDRGRQGH